METDTIEINDNGATIHIAPFSTRERVLSGIAVVATIGVVMLAMRCCRRRGANEVLMDALKLMGKKANLTE